MYPSDRKYTTDFGWIRVDGAEATVGTLGHPLGSRPRVMH
jgi:hypothetical protein